jgi:hypothetical protein
MGKPSRQAKTGMLREWEAYRRREYRIYSWQRTSDKYAVTGRITRLRANVLGDYQNFWLVAGFIANSTTDILLSGNI